MIAQADTFPLQVTSIKTASYAARFGELVQCDASGGSFTVTLPGSPRVNQIVAVKLLKTTGGNSVTVARNGKAIEGEAGDPSLSETGEYLELQYNGAGNWIDRTEQESSGNSAVATITASTTLTLDQEVVLCNNTSNITVTLPTAVGNAGKPYTLKKIGDNSATVTVDAAGSETIDGAATVLLYIRNDFVGIISDGSNWQIVQDGLLPHACRMYMNPGMVVPSATNTPCDWNQVDFDRGGIANTTAGRVTIRRAGVYNVQGQWNVENSARYNVQCRVKVNSSSVAISTGYIEANNTYSRVMTGTTIQLSAGDDITLDLIQNGSGNYTSSTGLPFGPYISVSEVR